MDGHDFAETAQEFEFGAFVDEVVVGGNWGMAGGIETAGWEMEIFVKKNIM